MPSNTRLYVTLVLVLPKKKKLAAPVQPVQKVGPEHWKALITRLGNALIFKLKSSISGSDILRMHGSCLQSNIESNRKTAFFYIRRTMFYVSFTKSLACNLTLDFWRQK